MRQTLSKHYFRLNLLLYAVALVFCGTVRILLKFRYMEPETGFYIRPTPVLATIFTVVLTAVILVLYIANRLRRISGDYPVHYNSPLSGVLCVLTGAAICLYMLLERPYDRMIEQAYSPTAVLFRDRASIVLGVVGGLALVWLGISVLRGRISRWVMIPVLFAAIWQVFMLITRFNSYTVLTSISDNLLAVLFMVFASLFLVGQARTTFGLTRKDGRNYTIPSGLCASLLGFLLVVPNVLYSLVNRTSMPAPMLGTWESVYVIVLSVYAVTFVVGMIRSIRSV